MFPLLLDMFPLLLCVYFHYFRVCSSFALALICFLCFVCISFTFSIMFVCTCCTFLYIAIKFACISTTFLWRREEGLTEAKEKVGKEKGSAAVDVVEKQDEQMKIEAREEEAEDRRRSITVVCISITFVCISMSFDYMYFYHFCMYFKYFCMQ